MILSVSVKKVWGYLLKKVNSMTWTYQKTRKITLELKFSNRNYLKIAKLKLKLVEI